MKKLLLIMLIAMGVQHSANATWSNRDKDTFFVLLDSISIYTLPGNDTTKTPEYDRISNRLLTRTRTIMMKYQKENYYEWMRVMQNYYYPNWEYTTHYYAYGHNTLFLTYMSQSTPTASTTFQKVLVDVLARKQWYLFLRPDIATKFKELPYSKNMGLTFAAYSTVLFNGWIKPVNRTENLFPVVADKIYKFGKLHPELTHKTTYPSISEGSDFENIYWVRNPMYTLLSSMRLRDRSITDKARDAIGVAQMPFEWERKFWDTFNVVVQHCGHLTDEGLIMNMYRYYEPQVRNARYNVAANAVTGAPYMKPYFSPYFSTQTTGGHAIFWSPRGGITSGQLNERSPGNRFDVNTTTNIHEQAHQVWAQSLDYPANRAYLLSIVDRLGIDPKANLRLGGDAWYSVTPQEIFASFSNHYVSYSELCLQSVLRRYEDGIQWPLLQFLWMANGYSQNRPYTVFYHATYGPDAELSWWYVPVERDADGFITRLEVNECEVYNFTYDEDHNIKSVSYPSRKQLLAEGSSCVDLDLDNDGISNQDEGYLGELLDLGDYGAIGATGATNNVSKTLFVPAPDGDSINLRLQKNSSDNAVVVYPSGGDFALRDPSSDGSLINFKGKHSQRQYTQARFYFGTPLNDVSFALADLDKESSSSPEVIEILYRNGKQAWQYLPKEYISNLTPGQAGPIVDGNLIYGASVNNDNVFSVRIPIKITELIVRVPALNNDTRSFDFNFSLFNLSWSKDDDKDGISNNYDWDSDGDGCPDALEGTKVAKFADLNYLYQVEGEEDSLGFPLLFGGAQGVGTSQNDTIISDACDHCAPTSELASDRDADGVMDVCDLDNDNDGITDEEEQAYEMVLDWASLADSLSTDSVECFGATCSGRDRSHVVLEAPNGEKVTVTCQMSKYMYGSGPYGEVEQKVTAFDPYFSPLNPRNEDGAYTVRKSANTRNGGFMEIWFSRPVTNVHFYITGVDAGVGGHAPEYIIVGPKMTYTWLPNDRKNFRRVSGATPIVMTEYELLGKGSSKDNVIEVTLPGPLNTIELSVNGGYAVYSDVDVAFSNIHFSADQDKDNIPNCFDLDSDNDGCPDAIEGSKSITTQNVTSTGIILGPVDASGIPSSVAGGQNIGTSLNASTQDPDCISTAESWADWYSANEDNIKIFPNPVNRGESFRVKKMGIETIHIYDMMGSLVATRVYDNAIEVAELSSSEFIPGAYYLVINGSEEDRAYFIVH